VFLFNCWTVILIFFAFRVFARCDRAFCGAENSNLPIFPGFLINFAEKALGGGMAQR
jgi:hypothetical protein